MPMDDITFRVLKREVTFQELKAILHRESRSSGSDSYPGEAAIVRRYGWDYNDFLDERYKAGDYSSCRGF